MRIQTFIGVFALAAAAHAQHHDHGRGADAASPYAGFEQRAIKALSVEETRSLLEGRGMTLALAAELNGYPGPMHVLEHADRLGLSPAQRERTQALMHTHKAEARALGAAIVEAERALDASLATGQATAETVSAGAARIGELQGRLRAAHLRTHLEQTALLSREQVARYQQARGYAARGDRP